MASTRLLKAKDGRQYYEIRCHKRGRGEQSTRWYIPDGWSKTAIEKELSHQVSAFESSFLRKEILTKEENKAIKAAEEAERAKLKTFRQYAEGVFLPAKAFELSENTKASYKSNLELHVYPIIGDLLLTEITQAEIRSLILNYQANHAHSSMIKVFNIMKGVFDMAFDDGSIPVSPMLRVKRPRISKDEKGNGEKKEALDEKSANYVLSCLANEPIKWHTFIKLAIDTGCRRGELCALEWEDIDLKNNTVNIRQNVQYTAGKGVYITKPKNGETRIVYIADDTVSLLRQWKKEQHKTCICKYVFNPEKSNQYKYKDKGEKQPKKGKEKKTIPIETMPMNPQSPTRYFKTFGNRYGIPGFHPHLIRHTFGSLSVKNGVDIVTVAKLMGHKDPSTTGRWYIHPDEESKRKAAQKVHEALKAAGQ